MKLVVTAKYLFAKSRSKPNLLLPILFLFLTTGLFAQKYHFEFDHRPLSDVMVEVAKSANIKVAFDAQSLNNITITTSVSANSPEEILDKILKNTGFVYQYKHSRFLIFNDPSLTPNTSILNGFQLSGAVTDSESGEQLPYARLVVNQALSSFASANGTFFFKKLTNNDVHLSVSYIGYLPLDTLITPKSEDMSCNLKLKRKNITFDSVVVKGGKVDMIEFRNDADFATTINPAKLIDLPILTETDIFKALQLLPGVSYSENSSELSIRGGSSDQNLVLYDGQTLYNLSHYYGVFSSINPNIVKDIQIYKGGYDSRYGERVSGIVDITGKSGNQLKPMVYGDINRISGNIATEVPIGKKLTLVAAGRRSYSDIYATEFSKGLFNNTTVKNNGGNTEVINQLTPKYKFYDSNGKLTWHLSEKENISVGGFGGTDVFSNAYDSKSNGLQVTTSEKNTWNNYGLSANWMKQWSGIFHSNLQVGTTSYANDYSNNTEIVKSTTTTKSSVAQTPTQSSQGSQPTNQQSNTQQSSQQPTQVGQQSNNPLPTGNNYFETANQNELSDFSAAIRNTCYLSNTNQLNFGLQTRRNTVYYHKDAGQVYVYDNINQEAWTTSAYAQDRISLTDGLVVKPGVRFSFYNQTQKVYFEPRLAANYQFTNHISVRAATGRYYQFISQVISLQETGYTKNFWMLSDGYEHPIVASNHFIVGTTLEWEHLLFDVETYYKQFSGLQEYVFVSQYLKNSDFGSLFKPDKPGGRSQASFYASGNGQAMGADFLMRYNNRFYTSWIAYSLSRSERRFTAINNNAWFASPTDQTHQLSYANMISWRKFNFGTVTLFSTGRPYVVDSKTYTNNTVTREYNRLSNYFRTDVSVNYNLNVSRVKMKVGATLINVFNTKNYFDTNSRKFDFENASFTETNLVRSQSMALNLFLHFVL